MPFKMLSKFIVQLSNGQRIENNLEGGQNTISVKLFWDIAVTFVLP